MIMCVSSIHFSSTYRYHYRLSVPYTPPTPKYMSLEDVVRHYGDFSYQLYLANEKSTAEIESNVRVLSHLFGGELMNKPLS